MLSVSFGPMQLDYVVLIALRMYRPRHCDYENVHTGDRRDARQVNTFQPALSDISASRSVFISPWFQKNSTFIQVANFFLVSLTLDYILDFYCLLY